MGGHRGAVVVLLDPGTGLSRAASGGGRREWHRGPLRFHRAADPSDAGLVSGWTEPKGASSALRTRPQHHWSIDPPSRPGSLDRSHLGGPATRAGGATIRQGASPPKKQPKGQAATHLLG